MRRSLKGFFSFFLAAICLSSFQPLAAESWPRFRGPNGSGIAADKDVPVRWESKEAIAWQTSIPGVGNSSPIVFGDKVFLQSAKADGSERSLVCLNAVDGKINWSQSIPGTRAKTHPKNSLASSTPATDGERVYAVFWDGAQVAIYAYDFAGKMLWKQGMGGFTSQHGVGMSPAVFQGKVFISNDQDGTAELVTLDAASGKVVWQAKRNAFRACYSTPMILEHPGAEPELIVQSTAGITSYQPHSGDVNWNFTWTFDGMALRTVSSPIYSHGMIFANSGDGGGSRHSIAIKAGGKGELSRSALIWEEKKAFPYVPCMLAYGDFLYMVSDRGIASCHELANGKEIWNERLGGNVTASPVLIDGKIYVVNEDGMVYVYLADPTFKLLAKNRLGEQVLSSPAVADNRLFIRGEQHLFCIAKPKK